MKDRTGQQYDAEALENPDGGRADYDASLIRHLDPRVSLNISGTVGGERAAARCRTGYVLSSDSTCEKCGASPGDACRSTLAGTSGGTAGAKPDVASDADGEALAGAMAAVRRTSVGYGAEIRR
jgi:hypothetical protein